MKKNNSIIKVLILASLCSAILSSCTINKPEEKVRTITVNGTGTVNITPDLLMLTFSVKSSDWNVNNAATANATTTEKVINAIKEAGVDAKDIQTFDYRINQETYMSNGREYPGKYNVTNSLNVCIRNIENAGNVIDNAIKNGTNALSGFEYSVSDSTSALRQARTIAVQNAQDAAALLAGASGCKVDQVLDIQEGYSSTHQNRKMVYSMAADGATPLSEGTVEVSANVTITYSLIN